MKIGPDFIEEIEKIMKNLEEILKKIEVIIEEINEEKLTSKNSRKMKNSKGCWVT